jgi:hypothetical protein
MTILGLNILNFLVTPYIINPSRKWEILEADWIKVKTAGILDIEKRLQIQ